MLECPSCRKNVAHKGQDKWFECPECRNWIRLIVETNGLARLQLGVLAGGVIQPVQIIKPPGQPARSATAAPASSLQRAPQAQQQAASTNSGSSGMAIGCGAILMGVGLYVFSLVVGLQLDFKTFMIIALISAVAGFLTFIIAQFD